VIKREIAAAGMSASTDRKKLVVVGDGGKGPFLINELFIKYVFTKLDPLKSLRKNVSADQICRRTIRTRLHSDNLRKSRKRNLGN